MPSGKDIVFVIGKTGIVAAQGTGGESGPETDVPLALLVDSKTASASEVSPVVDTLCVRCMRVHTHALPLT